MISALAAFPARLRELCEALPAGLLRVPPAAGGFALVEHVWHLADLEVEGFSARISRLLAEDNPLMPDFDGPRLARERDYRALSLPAGLARFAAARAENLARLAAIGPVELVRIGIQEGVGRVTLGEIPSRMEEHDRAHAGEIAALIAEIAPAMSFSLV